MRTKLTGVDAEPFVLEGDDWFDLSDPSTLPWLTVLEVVEREQKRLADSVADIDAGRARSPLEETERFDLVLGIACHGIYHAGQIQLIKRLASA